MNKGEIMHDDPITFDEKATNNGISSKYNLSNALETFLDEHTNNTYTCIYFSIAITDHIHLQRPEMIL